MTDCKNCLGLRVALSEIANSDIKRISDNPAALREWAYIIKHTSEEALLKYPVAVFVAKPIER